MRSKQYQSKLKLINPIQTYSLDEAIDLVKKTSYTKFDASIELHIKLGINASEGEQQVKGMVTLPHGTGKIKRIAVFTENSAEEALTAGAAVAGGKELIDKIKTTGKVDFDIALAEPAIMKMMAPIAKILGPKGLMPSPKNETVTKDFKKTLEELAGGKIIFKNDDSGNIHQIVGKVSYPDEKIKKNIETFLNAVKKAKPSTLKGEYIRNISLCGTMGPAVRISNAFF